MSMDKVLRIISILEKEIEIDWFLKNQDPFKVLIKTLLSQRTRDENTDRASRRLFSKFKNARQLAKANLNDIERLIKPSGFYRVKARRIKEISRALVKNNGKVPKDIDGLLNLPGIGRKTANCVLVYAYGEPSIPIDTHCHRIPNRIGLVKTKNPEQTESELMRIVPKDKWIEFNELFVKFGQRICKPVKPLCYECPIERLCEYENKSLK
ncbi:MAG: endonuclease III [Candidatus Aenigmatarchaeota archaeon]|nr:MAG: endonuclease III [Candidatus Aenigmarchaeota archaeon]